MALSLQDQLAQKIKDLHPNAEVKKINKDNFLDIHIPSVHPKRGTHLFFNTSKDLIKVGFYCREEDFIEEILQRTKSLERYSQGIRPLGNPEFNSVEEAVSSANSMLNNMVKAPIKASKEEEKGAKPTKEQASKKESNKSLATQKEETKATQNSQTKSSPNKANKKDSNEYCFDDPESFLTSIQLLRNYYLALSSSSNRFRSSFEKLLLDFTGFSVVPKIGDDILRIMHEDGFGIGALLLKPMYDAEKIYDEEFETHDEYVTYLENYVSDINTVADQTLLLDTISFLIKLGNILDENESPSGNLSAQDRYFPVFLILKTNPNLELNKLKSVLKEIDYEDVDTLLLKASGNFKQLSADEKFALILYDFILVDENPGLDIKMDDITAAKSIYTRITQNKNADQVLGGFDDNDSFEVFQFFNVYFEREGFHNFCLERWKELTSDWNPLKLQLILEAIKHDFHPLTYVNNEVLDSYLEIYGGVATKNSEGASTLKERMQSGGIKVSEPKTSDKTKKVKIGDRIVIDASKNTLICNLFHKILFVIITTGSNFKPEGEYDEDDPEILRYTDDAVNDVSQSALAMASWFNYDEDDCADFLNETYEMIGELKKQSFILSDIAASFCYIIHEKIDTEEGRNDIVRFMMDHAQVDGEIDELEDIYLDLNKSKILFGRLF
jgi:hypothetical protein